MNSEKKVVDLTILSTLSSGNVLHFTKLILLRKTVCNTLLRFFLVTKTI